MAERDTPTPDDPARLLTLMEVAAWLRCPADRRAAVRRYNAGWFPDASLWVGTEPRWSWADLRRFVRAGGHPGGLPRPPVRKLREPARRRRRGKGPRDEQS